jgi:ATP-dependent DNA helicase PIF1
MQVEVVREEMFLVENEGIVMATRKQIPLDLAYALTVHKSQGMSFDFVAVDLFRVFEAGQAYVAV